MRQQFVWLIVIIVVQVVFCQRPQRHMPGRRTRDHGHHRAHAPPLDCIDYGAFRDKSWICQDDIQCPDFYDAAEINLGISLEVSPGNRYNGACYKSDVDDCIQKGKKPKLVERPKDANREVAFEELCEMHTINVTNLYVHKREFTHPELCIVVNTDWMTQSLYFAKCTNPRNPNHDMCQLDYGYRNEYRCVQSGFVWRTIWAYCPRTREYHTTDVLVPTTCSCRKCAHCETSHGLIDDFMRNFELSRGGSGPSVRNPSQLKPKPEKCVLPGQKG